MNPTTFERELTRDGYTPGNSELQAMEPKPLHTHDFDARILVLEGAITIAWEDGKTTYRKGDVYDVPAGTPHTEIVGAEGVSLLTGKRNPAQV